MNRCFVRRTIRNILIILASCLVLTSPLAARKAPDFTLPTIDGKSVTLSELRGQVVYVDFWATWCPPCRKSFPWMQKMHDRYAKSGLNIIAISLDGKRELNQRYRDIPERRIGGSENLSQPGATPAKR